MKLELKRKLEIALYSYLPYGLRRQWLFGANSLKQDRTQPVKLRDIDWLLKAEKAFIILHPLSDLTENIANKYGYCNVRLFIIGIREQEIQIKLWNNLLAEHWDVFSLINDGSAIDINTLKKQS